MHEVKSLSLFVGSNSCNANCSHCAGRPLRKYAPKEDGIVNEELIYKTIKDCHQRGARYLSISSSGEPTLSPISITKILKLIHSCKKENIKFSPINLYSNGIKIGNDKDFSNKYLPLWKNLGLTTIYITVHNINEKENARIYGIEKYPSLKTIISRIHNANISTRANIVLSKNTIETFEEFQKTILSLKKLGFDSISAWLIRNMEDKLDTLLSPQKEEVEKMANWIKKEKLENVKLLIGKESREKYKKGEKLTLFPNGKLSNTWCN